MMLRAFVPRAHLLPLLTALSAGCGFLPGEGEGTDSDTDANADTDANEPSESATSGETVDTGDTGDTEVSPSTREVDIVFVVDNSGSMSASQAKLATSIQALTDTLDAAVPPVDYRIAVTTTDNGNPFCSSNPEAGEFRATSCRQRISEFVFGGTEIVDMTDEACLDICTHEDLNLVEPWIAVNRSTDTTNLPNGDVVGALRCMLPQGLDGCGFEQPLESLHKALLRSDTADEPSYGFSRPGALLAVAIVTDEDDCSHNTDHEAIFDPDGNRVFWGNQDVLFPSSAVCWNAGVQCTGADPYDCVTENFDVDGNPTLDPDAAVLHPLSQYIDDLNQRGAYVIAINGVGANGEPVYTDGDDAQFRDDFGIGAGCTGTEGDNAVPPVRVRALVDSVAGPGNLHSICDDDYLPALTSMGQGILARLP
ncbi:MAG: hypothetical protein AAGF11_31035 [Myxococcota bacterium]